MLKSSLKITVAAVTLITTTVLGCGLGEGSTSTVKTTKNNVSMSANAPFVNKLKMDIVSPSHKFDIQPANPSKYQHLTVYSSSGKLVTLNANKEPLLFEAYWCPHCQRTLVMLNKYRKEIGHMPTIISIGFQPGTSLRQAKQLTSDEFSYFHLSNARIYYLLAAELKPYVPHGIPQLVFDNNNSIVMLSGEHTFSVWKDALK